MKIPNWQSKFKKRNYALILPIVLAGSLSIFYSNCSQFRSLNSDLSDEELLSQEFGVNGNDIDINVRNIDATVDVSPNLITEGEVAQFSSSITYSRNGNGAMPNMDFNCTGALNGLINLNVNCTSKDENQECQSYSGSSSGEIANLKAGDYSCSLSFTYGNQIGNPVSRTLRVRVKEGKQLPPSLPENPPKGVCEGDELVQGNFEGCDNDSCYGWAFQYGQVSAPLVVNVVQSGAANRNVTFTTNTKFGRSDIVTHLEGQGCYGGVNNPGDIVTGFDISKAAIDQQLKQATSTPGNGKLSSIKVTITTNGKFIGSVDNYIPASPIDSEDPPPPNELPPPPPSGPTCPAGYIDGHLDGCNQNACGGWAFVQGKNSARIVLVAEQTGSIRRTVSIGGGTSTNRDDVTTHLNNMGCFNANVQAAYRISKSDIDAAILATPATAGTGSSSSITIKGFIQNGTSLIPMPETHNYAPSDSRVLTPPNGGGNNGEQVVNRTIHMLPSWTGGGGSTWNHSATLKTYNNSSGTASFGIESSSSNPNLIPRFLNSFGNITVTGTQSGQMFNVGQERRETSTTDYIVKVQARFTRSNGKWKIDFYHQTASRPKSTPTAAWIEGPLSPLHGTIEF
ncbi:MAG: hypothetical protein KDD35_04160 [Bdellovibrionales bacterium]|nr:hypothetical protein [Bdellovibrionales bacterium]